MQLAQKVVISLLLVCIFITPISAEAQHSTTHLDSGMQHEDAYMVGEFVLQSPEGEPMPDIEVTAFDQTRTADEQGLVQFEHVMPGENTIILRSEGKTQELLVTIESAKTTVTVPDEWKTASQPSDTSSTNNTIMVLGGVTVLSLAIVLFFAQRKNRALLENKLTHNQIKLALGACAAIAVCAGIGFVYTYLNSGASQLARSSQASELTSIPVPVNVRGFGDDRVATIQWEAPENADAARIVGYVVQWGKASDNRFTDWKQTIHTATQIQPLEENTEYIVSVRAVRGRTEERLFPEAWNNVPSEIAIADGSYSPPAQISVRTSNARVDAMRQRLTGFFDDFNMPAGNFDERKWNSAYTACGIPSEIGNFINSQYHAHNQMRSGDCDRGGTTNRPRAIWNVAGATEQNPALLEFDFDGVSHGRDIWYVDLIPVNARNFNGTSVPLDMSSHNDFFSGDTHDPGNMLRIRQTKEGVELKYWNANRQPSTISPIYEKGVNEWGAPTDLCSHWSGQSVAFESCDPTRKITKYSPLSQPDFSLLPVPNVRRHWVVEYSPTKVKIFIDGTLLATWNTPPAFASNTQLQVHNVLFSYNTGKDSQFETVTPTTAMLHWDNFGFSGPAPTTVTHNYLEGGTNGSTPYIGRGLVNKLTPSGARQTIVRIPDQIRTPEQARVHLTFNNFGFSSYRWSSNDHILINGTRVNMPDPRDTMLSPRYSGDIAGSNLSYSMAFIIPNPGTVLRTGDNTLDINIGTTDFLNVHVEIDYRKGTEPSFTQPQNIFTDVVFNDHIMPRMREIDMYWYIEQKMGLTVPPGQQPEPTNILTQAPTAPPTSIPTAVPTSVPTTIPTVEPSAVPTVEPQQPDPTSTPEPTPVIEPTEAPLPTDVPAPTVTPTNLPGDPSPTTPSVDPTERPQNPDPSPTEVIRVPQQSPTASPNPDQDCPRKPEGDANCDNRVNLIDFEIFRAEYLSGSGRRADFNADGRVSLVDIQILIQTFLRE